MSRAVAIVLALFVAAQSTAVAGERMVCRYTGKVMENCPCPRGTEPVVEKPGCCTVVRSEAAPVAAPRELLLHQLALNTVVAARWEMRAPELPLVMAPVESPPPLERQYLRFRQLLI